MGYAMHGAMGGYVPLTYQEIHAYLESTNTTLNGDEVVLIREMSESFCQFVNNPSKHLEKP